MLSRRGHSFQSEIRSFVRSGVFSASVFQTRGGRGAELNFVELFFFLFRNLSWSFGMFSISFFFLFLSHFLSLYYRISLYCYNIISNQLFIRWYIFTECVSRSGDTARYNIRRNLERPDGTWGWVCKTSMQSPRLSKTWYRLETGGWRRDYFPCRIVWWQNEKWV